MTPTDFLHDVIDPACNDLSRLMTTNMSDERARVLLLAIALQETNLEHRRQIKGPARGWWQFEKAGATLGVLENLKSAAAADSLCKEMFVPTDVASVHEALAWHDHLAAGFARLLLLTDSKPLPAVTDVKGAWEYYVRNWRPGKPHPGTWGGYHRTALEAVTGGPTFTLDAPAVVVPPAHAPGSISTVFKSGWKSSETWIAIAGVAVPILLQLLDTAAANSAAVDASPWVVMGIYMARQAFKGMAALQVAPATIPGTGAQP